MTTAYTHIVKGATGIESDADATLVEMIARDEIFDGVRDGASERAAEAIIEAKSVLDADRTTYERLYDWTAK